MTNEQLGIGRGGSKSLSRKGGTIDTPQAKIFTIKYKIFKLLLVYYIKKYYNPYVKMIDKSKRERP